MVSSTFTYSKLKVIQALRYHFISRPEIKAMVIIVNVFAIGSALLYYFKEVTSFAFLLSSMLWFFLMLLFWYALPAIIYRQNKTFKDSFKAYLSDKEFSIENERNGRSWAWKDFSGWTESPFFFHLYFTARSFFLIPKDAFPGQDEEEARKIFIGRIGKKK